MWTMTGTAGVLEWAAIGASSTRSDRGTHLCVAGPQTPLQLHCADGVHGVRFPQVLRRHLAEPQVPHLAPLDQLLHVGCALIDHDNRCGRTHTVGSFRSWESAAWSIQAVAICAACMRLRHSSTMAQVLRSLPR